MNLRNYFALLFVLLCGFWSYTNAQFRIANGLDITIEESPHSVAIFSDCSYRCVGSLVNMNSVVTAAHCVIREEQNKLDVVAGVAYLRKINTGSGQRRKVQRIHHDPAYDPQTRFMDIAVVKVDGSFKENDAVKSILLCDYQIVPGMTMQVSGWGVKSETSSDNPYILQTTYVDIVDTQECKTTYANRQNPRNLAETIICAGCGGEDVCIGDSGAPGILNKRLCAVVQGGCGDPNVPSLYTDVTNAKVWDFITSNM